MSTMERTSSEQTGALAMRAGQWGTIEKEQYRPYDLERGVEVPLFQGVVAGVAVATPVVVVLWLLFTWRVALAGGALTGSVAFAVVALRGLAYSRSGLESSEYWESEALSLGQQVQHATVDKATVRVEMVEQSGPYPKYTFDELPVSLEVLRKMSPTMSISKRTVMALGVGDTEAMRVVAELERTGYARREASNEGAQWTKKGLALCRAVGGGGGGGGTGDGFMIESSGVGEGEA